MPVEPDRPPEVVDAGAVELRRWRPADLEALLSASRESWQHLRPWMPWARDEPDEESQGGFLRAAVVSWQEGTAFQYGAWEPGGAVVGSFGLEKRIGAGGLEIGYWVRVGWTGRGIARAGARALTEVAFGMPEVDRVEIHCDEANVASAAVPRALGYALVEVRPDDVEAPNEVGREMVWRATRDTWRPISRA